MLQYILVHWLNYIPLFGAKQYPKLVRGPVPTCKEISPPKLRNGTWHSKQWWWRTAAKWTCNLLKKSAYSYPYKLLSFKTRKRSSLQTTERGNSNTGVVLNLTPTLITVTLQNKNSISYRLTYRKGPSGECNVVLKKNRMCKTLRLIKTNFVCPFFENSWPGASRG